MPEAEAESLRLRLSQLRADQAAITYHGGSQDKLARVEAEITRLEAELAVIEAGPEPPSKDAPPDWQTVGQLTGQEPALPLTLEQCKAGIRSLSNADRQQLILWIARGMPKND